MTHRYVSAFLSFTAVAIAVAACSSTPETSSSNESALGPAAAGGVIGAFCTEATGNSLGKYIVDAFGGGLPDSDKAGAALCDESKGRPTTECKDYCETRNPTGTASTIADILSYSSFNTYIPPQYWSQIVNYLTSSKTTTTQAGVVQCATLVGWAAAEFYYADRACARDSQCMTCDETSKTVRSGCLIGQTVLWCAEALGFKTPPAVSSISAACTVGRLCSKGVLLEGCRRSCAASLPLAAPIAQPVVTEKGTTRRCCSCERSKWEDLPLIKGGDAPLGNDYYYSPVSDYDGPVNECEGRERTTSEIAADRGPNGYSTYYYYRNCQKATFDGAVCPSDHGYHAPSRGAGQLVKSRQDGGQCLTHGGDGADVFMSACSLDNANQRWAVEQVSRDGNERTIRLKPQTSRNLCLDMHQSETVQGSGYRAYLHSCHDGDNQKFVDRGGELLQRYTRNNYCLDWWFTNGGTVHMPTCHSSAYLGNGTPGANQLWDIVSP